MARHLNPRQQTFVRLYVSGPPGVCGNGAAAYVAAGYQAKTPQQAAVCACKLLTKTKIAQEIHRLNREADALVILQIRDWKVLAPQAQQRIQRLACGLFPARQERDGEAAGDPLPLTTREDAAVAHVILAANLEILERAYPKKLLLGLTDARAELATLLGVDVAEIPG